MCMTTGSSSPGTEYTAVLASCRLKASGPTFPPYEGALAGLVPGSHCSGLMTTYQLETRYRKGAGKVPRGPNPTETQVGEAVTRMDTSYGHKKVVRIMELGVHYSTNTERT